MSSFGYLHSISGIAQYKLRQLLQDRGTEPRPRLDLMATGSFWHGPLTCLQYTETLFTVSGLTVVGQDIYRRADAVGYRKKMEVQV